MGAFSIAFQKLSNRRTHFFWGVGLPLILVLSLPACQSSKTTKSVAPRPSGEIRKIHFASMGSPWTLEYAAPEDKSLLSLNIESLFQKTLKTYEETFSDWNDESELRRLEKEGLSSPSHLKASPLFIEGLEISKEAHTLSDGLFDLSMGAVIWKERSRPAGMLTLDIRSDLSKFRFGVNPARLSFGGIAKGMCLGDLAEKLLQNGIRDFKIEAGGGNSVYSGNFARDLLTQADTNESISNEKPCESLYFVSRSSAEQKGKQHIFNPKKIEQIIKGSTILSCMSCSKTQLKRFGALNDALSTSLLIGEFKVPEELQCSLKRNP